MAIATPRQSLSTVFALVAALSALASKCFTHETGFDEPAEDGGGGQAGAAGAGAAGGGGEGGGSGGGGSGGGNGFAAATPCDTPGTARLAVFQRAFSIQCGCAEDDGKTCTVPLHTTVIWTFLDTEAHNVTSMFGDSPDKLSGTYKRTFDELGAFPYGCSIHATMKGYEVDVIEP